MNTPEALLRMPHETFKNVVDKDLRAPTADTPEGKKRTLKPHEAPDWYARHASLRTPPVVDRWYMTLNQIAKSVDGQLAAKTEDYEADRATLRARLLLVTDDAEANQIKAEMETLKARFSKARAGTLRFKTGVDEAFVEARAMRDSARDRLFDSIVAEERNRYATRVAALEAAIREHREASLEAGVDAEPYDLRLWGSVDRETVG